MNVNLNKIDEIMGGVNAMPEQYYRHEAPLKPGGQGSIGPAPEEGGQNVHCHLHRPVPGGGRLGTLRGGFAVILTRITAMQTFFC